MMVNVRPDVSQRTDTITASSAACTTAIRSHLFVSLRGDTDQIAQYLAAFLTYGGIESGGPDPPTKIIRRKSTG
jgi:hypothetical protein